MRLKNQVIIIIIIIIIIITTTGSDDVSMGWMALQTGPG